MLKYLLLFSIAYCLSFRTYVLKSGALSFAPQFKVHHILVLEPPNKKHGIYLLDFTPINQTNPGTLMKLALGKWVPAEIRIRNIILPQDSILETWHNINRELSPDESRILSEKTLRNIKNSDLRNYIKDIKSSWIPEMNLYRHNCQDFTRKHCNIDFN